MLDLDERRKDADDGRCGDEHDQHPYVELQGRPVVFVDVADSALEDEGAAGCRVGRHVGGCCGDECIVVTLWSEMGCSAVYWSSNGSRLEDRGECALSV